MIDTKFCSKLLLSLLGAALLIIGSEASAATELADQWGFRDLNNDSYYHVSGVENLLLNQQNETDVFTRKRSRHKNRTITLFQADTSACRIGIEDRALLQTGQADFVTAFGGVDFQCSVIHANSCCGCRHPKKGPSLYIVPANGQFFTTGIPAQGEDGPVPGGLIDHVKFLAYSVNTTIPQKGGVLTSTWVASGSQTHVDTAISLFGDAVKNPNEDYRLACFGLVSLAPELLVTNDWICTNDMIYALVERLPTEGTDYAAYTFIIPLFKRNPKVSPLEDFHKFQTTFDRANGTVTWILDDKPVLRITQIGSRLTESNAFIFNKRGRAQGLKNPNRFKVLDHGGTDTIVELINVQTGLSFFTLLDAYQPNNVEGINDSTTQGLVRLESSNFRTPGSFYYNNPLLAQPGTPATFVQGSILNVATQQYEQTIPSQFRLFGQGAVLILSEYNLSIKKNRSRR